MTIHFDQYQRYNTAKIFIEALKKHLSVSKLAILEIGANEHKNLEKFCPQDEIKYLDIVVPEHLLNDSQYIIGDATNLVDILDNSYDLVIALDVFEHIPSDKRQNFISELERVSRLGVFIGAPFASTSVENAEIRGNCYYRLLKNMDHKWLIEHIENKLPSIDETIEFIEQLDKKYFVFEHGSLEIWEMINYYLWKVEGKECESELILNNYYNTELYKSDISNNNYRKFIFITDNYFLCKKIEKELKNNFTSDDKILTDSIFNLKRILDNLNDTFLLKELSEKSDNTKTDLSDSLETNVRKIYLDLGEGFNEEDTIIFETNESDEVEIKVCDKGDIKQIRIDLSESRLLVEINEIRLCYKDYEKIVDVKKWISNAAYIKENLYFFLTKDPFIIIDEENLLGIKSIKLNFKVIEEGF